MDPSALKPDMLANKLRSPVGAAPHVPLEF
jgi:hypothetical protein